MTENARNLLGKLAKFSGFQDTGIDQRELPGAADPYAPKESQVVVGEFRSGDDFITNESKEATAAVKDARVKLVPDYVPFFLATNYNEPVDHSGKVFKSPVFISDPLFTDDMED